MSDLMAPAFDLELPDPPDKAELLDKADKVRRRALHLPDPQPAELVEPPVLACPICGCDVSGCTLSIGDDGLRRWTQPIKEAWHRGTHRELSGGLVHIEGGKRCLSDAENRTR